MGLDKHQDNDPLQQQARELTILKEVAQALNETLDLDDALQTTLALVADLFHLKTGWIWLLDEQTQQTYLAAAQHLPPGLTEDHESMQGSCACISLYEDGDLAGASNIKVVHCSRLRWLLSGTNGLGFHATITLNTHDKHLGLLNLASSDFRELSEDDLRILRTVGDMLATAIERARLFAQQQALGSMRERNRLAREIHDTLAQGLAAMILQLESAEIIIEQQSKSHPAEKYIETALGLARRNLEEARRSVMDLRAAPLAGKSLVEALQELAGDDVTFAVHGFHPLPPEVVQGFYRIAQEAVGNARRHAQADHIWLTLRMGVDSAELIIEDDGAGFDPSNLPSGHFGIIGINERAKLMGATVEISSAVGDGTRVLVHVGKHNP